MVCLTHTNLDNNVSVYTSNKAFKDNAMFSLLNSVFGYGDVV
jgi:hypothetical protein